MPTPRKGESEKNYVPRCIAYIMHEGKTGNPSEAAAICHSMYREWRKKQRKELGLVLMFKGGTGSGSWEGPGRKRNRKTRAMAISKLTPSEKNSALEKLRKEKERREGGGKPKEKPVASKPSASKVETPSENLSGIKERMAKNYNNFIEDKEAAKIADTLSQKEYQRLAKDFPGFGELKPVDNLNMFGTETLGDVQKSHKEKIFPVRVTGFDMNSIGGFYCTNIKNGNRFLSIAGTPDEWKKSNSKLNTGSKVSIDSSPVGTLRHEMGHHFHFSSMGLGSTSPLDKELSKAIKEAGGYKKAGKKISDYATYSKYEFVAEAFSMYTHSEYKKGMLPSGIEKVLGKWLKKEGSKKKELGLALMFKGGSGSGNFDHEGIPGHVGGSAGGRASKVEVARQLAKIKKTEMSNHGKIREARRTLDSILINTPKQKEQANKYSSLLRRYEEELPENQEKKKELGIMLMFKHRNHPAMGPKHNTGSQGKIDIASYKKLSAQGKVKVLKNALKNYTENYVPKAKQTRILNKLSNKGRQQWIENNKRIGQMEGIRRAMIARGDSSSRVEQRKNYHYGIKLQEQALAVKGEMKKFKGLSSIIGIQ